MTKPDANSQDPDSGANQDDAIWLDLVARLEGRDQAAGTGDARITGDGVARSGVEQQRPCHGRGTSSASCARLGHVSVRARACADPAPRAPAEARGWRQCTGGQRSRSRHHSRYATTSSGLGA